MSTIDLKEQMKNAMRSLGGAVSIITCADETSKYAMTATAISSLSLDPPSILVCVNRDTGLHDALTEKNDFCVNILSASQEILSENCAWKLSAEERFSEGNWQDDEKGIPYLTDAQSSIHCHLDGSYQYGSHTIFIGKIHHIKTSEDINPLLYLDGKYFSPLS